MFATILPLGALLSGTALLLLGSGLLGTLLGVRGSYEGYGDQVLGLIMSGYFLGFFLGTFLAPRAIRRMGHIRAFSFFGALFASTVLAHAIWVTPVTWGLLRVATGLAVVGLYTVIESWLNATVEGAQRGRVFAVYMVINLAALAIGQQFLRLAAPESFALFSLVAILICAAMLPVTATRMAQPVMSPSERLGVRRLFRLAPAAGVGSLFSGISIGTFWGLAPVYAGRLELDNESVAMFMTVTIVGGALLQWPIGRLSDSGDRRRTLAISSLGAAVAAGAALFVASPTGAGLYIVYFLYGGLSFAIYPVAVAHLLDHVAPEDLLPACSTNLLLHGLGAALGPALAGFAMGRFGPGAFPGLLLVVHVLLAAYVASRLLIRTRVVAGDAHFHAMLRTSPTAMEMLPEVDAAQDELEGTTESAAPDPAEGPVEPDAGIREQ
ncbi:MFS transporter [Wenzhouxiangella sp. XN24]|uniref:MFS transporter n=1 Tax=Wenzhouxiangella sp. XN24 TaxID=2713569 RepID=UPI00197E96A3|nr:MFS transporter [Wenzhouxiangella sp. XN24]